MGNCCIVPQAKAKAIRVMKTDGKILEYKPPIKVYQVLSQFKSHAISDSLPPAAQHSLHAGCLYYLLPEPAKQKKVKFADQVEEEEEEEGVGQQVRIKLVISKQELKSMLSREGISLSDIVCHLKNNEGIGRWTTDQINTSDNVDDDDDEDVFSKGRWKPMLDSIPEI